MSHQKIGKAKRSEQERSIVSHFKTRTPLLLIPFLSFIFSLTQRHTSSWFLDRLFVRVIVLLSLLHSIYMHTRCISVADGSPGTMIHEILRPIRESMYRYLQVVALCGAGSISTSLPAPGTLHPLFQIPESAAGQRNLNNSSYKINLLHPRRQFCI